MSETDANTTGKYFVGEATLLNKKKMSIVAQLRFIFI